VTKYQHEREHDTDDREVDMGQMEQLLTPERLQGLAEKYRAQYFEQTDECGDSRIIAADDWELGFLFRDGQYVEWYGGPMERGNALKALKDVFCYPGP